MSSTVTFALPGAASVWPIVLILLLCCLFMLFGMRGMGQMSGGSEKPKTKDQPISTKEKLDFDKHKSA